MSTRAERDDELQREWWLDATKDSIRAALVYEARGMWAIAAWRWEKTAGYFVNAGDHYQVAWAEGRRLAALAQSRPQAPPNVSAICD
jgi:hypothetical protein